MSEVPLYHARPSEGYPKSLCMMILSTIGDECLQNGSKNVPQFQKVPLG